MYVRAECTVRCKRRCVACDASKITLDCQKRPRVLECSIDLLRGVNDLVRRHQALEFKFAIARNGRYLEPLERFAKCVPARADHRP